MATWSYDAFPLKRMDASTPGDDLQYVIQSLDAAIRHVFGLPTGVSMTPAFSIDSDGAVEILKSLSIGTSVLIDEIIDSIPESVATDEDEQLATVNAIRGHISTAVEAYLTGVDLFVRTAGDTMTGTLYADGGISASSYLSLENVLFTNNPLLGTGIALQQLGGPELIQYDSGVLVGAATEALRLTGSQTRPVYKTEQLCLLSDLVDFITDGSGLDYVPVLGGTFQGQVLFDDIIGFNQSSGLSILDVGTSLYTNVLTFDYSGDTPDGMRFQNLDFIFEGLIKIATAVVDADLALFDGSTKISLGDSSYTVNLVGSGTRPTFNDIGLALLSELGGSYLAGDGIAITDLGGDVYSVALEANGITEDHMPAGNPGEYARLDSHGVLVFENLDLVEGTGIALVETDGEFVISIDDLGVDTAQLAADAVDGTKIADDAIGVEHIDASGTLAAGTTYSLTVTDDALAWVENSGSGSGGFLSTVEILDTGNEAVVGDDGVSPPPAYATVVSGTSGPYIIEEIIYAANIGAGNWGVSLEIWIDGTLVTTTASLSTPDQSYINYPYYAQESFDIKARAGVSAAPTEGGYISCYIQRLA
jgi:hypothetical protein